jgi:hypothetical protein
MSSLNLQDRKDILIFELSNYRIVNVWNSTYNHYEKKLSNSYAIYNGATKELKIVDYDHLRTSTFDYSCHAFILNPGEKALVMNGFSCYYMDENGELNEKAGEGWSFFSKFDVHEINKKEERKQKPMQLLIDDDESTAIKKRWKSLDDGKILYGIADSNGKLLCDIKYTDIWIDSIIREQYIRVKIDELFGLISIEGKEILPVQYDYIDDCDGEIAVVNHGYELISVKDLSVLYSTKGKIHHICNGWMSVSKYYPPDESSNGILYKDGSFVSIFHVNKFGFRQEYDQLGTFINDGLLPVHAPNGYGYVDVEGKEVINCKYCEISDFNNGKAKVRFDCEYGYIDTKGRMLVKNGDKEIPIPSIYDWAYDFKEKYAVVQKGKFFGAIDECMNEIIPCSLNSKEDVERTMSKTKLFYQNLSEQEYNKAIIQLLPPVRYKENKLFGFKSIDGSLLCPPILSVRDFVEGLAVFSIGNGKKGYINEKLEIVIEPEYGSASDFSEGLALTYGDYINKNGEVVNLDTSFLEKLTPFKNGVVQCEYNRCQPGKDNDDYELTKFTVGYKTY